MIRKPLLPIAWLALAAAFLAPAARAGSEPSVLVQLTKLKKGSLPQIVDAYGTVEASFSAQRAVMAPTAAIVDGVYVHDGQEVAKSAPLLRLDPSPATTSAYAQAESALRVATDDVARTKKMVTQHLATAQQLAQAEKGLADARAALRALRSQGAGGANLLRAPSRAIVTKVAIRPGSIVAEGAILLSLADPTGLVLKVGVVPRQAEAIKPGDPAVITPLGSGETIAAKVLLRGAIVDSATGLIPVEIAFPLGQLIYGETASAAITTGEARGYVVPHEAILADDRGHPYVVQAIDMKAKQVAVRVIDAAGDQDVIEGPLDATAPLVLAGNHQLKNGMKMRTAQPPEKTEP